MRTSRGTGLSGPAILGIGLIVTVMHRILPQTAPWPPLCLGFQVAAMTWLLARWLTLRASTLLAVAAGAGSAAASLWFGLPAQRIALAAAALCHAVAYMSLLTWFGASLRPGRESVVTGFARRMRRTMPPDVVRYTRHATLAWCIFFAGQLLVSLALLASAPESVWRDFVTLWNIPSILAMALAEFLCRTIRFRHQQRTGLIATLAGMRQLRELPERMT